MVHKKYLSLSIMSTYLLNVCSFVSVFIIICISNTKAQLITEEEIKDRDHKSIVFIEADYFNKNINDVAKGPKGSGVIITGDGTVLTAIHVIDDWLSQDDEMRQAHPLLIRIGNSIPSGHDFSAIVIYPKHHVNGDGIAILKILQSDKFVSAPICFRGSLSHGEHLFVLGIPASGNIFNNQGKYADAIDPRGYWVSSLKMVPEMSGGPVYDSGGEVVGLSWGAEGVQATPSYIIPIALSVPLMKGYPASPSCGAAAPKGPPVLSLPAPPLPPSLPVNGTWDVTMSCPDGSSVNEYGASFTGGLYSRSFKNTSTEGITELSAGYVPDDSIEVKGYVAFRQDGIYTVAATAKRNGSSYSGIGKFGRNSSCKIAIVGTK